MALLHEATSNEYRLANPPGDCVQSVKFGRVDNQHMLTASWDNTVRLYDVVANQIRSKYWHDAPVLDVTFQGNNSCWSAGADNKIKCFDFQSQTDVTVGVHNAAVRRIDHLPDFNLVASGSWDQTIKLWDPRSADSSKQALVSSHQMPDKVYAMSVCGDKLIVGVAGRRIVIFDLRNMSQTVRDSMLKYQIRCVEAFADKRGFVVSSIEGRVAVEYLDPSPEIQKQKYVFKCHRNKDPTTGLEMIHPVNAISFHQRFNTFATGGSDGHVSIWDGKNKKRLVQYHRYPTSISSLSFSPDGNLLAIASSYLHASEDSDIPQDIPPDSVFIRRVNDQEVRNKS